MIDSLNAWLSKPADNATVIMGILLICGSLISCEHRTAKLIAENEKWLRSIGNQLSRYVGR